MLLDRATKNLFLWQWNCEFLHEHIVCFVCLVLQQREFQNMQTEIYISAFKLLHGISNFLLIRSS